MFINFFVFNIMYTMTQTEALFRQFGIPMTFW